MLTCRQRIIGQGIEAGRDRYGVGKKAIQGIEKMKAKPQHSARISEAVSKGICILPDCKRRAACRGLCESHANRFYGRKRKLTPDAFRQFEHKAIKAGLILAVGTVVKLNAVDEFSEAEK